MVSPLLGLALALPVPATVVAATHQGEAGEVRALQQAEAWHELVARDALLTFTRSAAIEARRDLKRGPGAEWAEAVALLALGEGGDAGDHELLVERAREGATRVRRGALFALGTLRPAGVTELETMVNDADPEVASAALLGLALAETPRAEAALEAHGRSSRATAEVARGARAFRQRLATASPGEVFETYLALRWAAARRYGFVDGMRWAAHLEADLARSDEFLDRVILTASAELGEGPRRDHLLEILLAPGTPERLRGAVRGMPGELARLLESGLWQPAGAAEWEALIDEIERRGVRAADHPVLILAAGRPSMARRAGLLLVSDGVAEGFELVATDLFAAEPERRLAVAVALGGLDDPARRPDLARLRRDEDPRVRAAALVSLVRLGDQPAIDTLAGLLEQGPSPARHHALDSLCQASADTSLHGFLDGALRRTDLAPDERLGVEIALSLHGRIQPREGLRKALDGSLDPELFEPLVRALAQSPSQEDLQRLRDVYPVENAFELNATLAEVLIANRDAGASGLLHHALWRGPWNRSILAAGLIVRLGGLQALHNELVSPPEGAREEDLRRVGFALGEWGGLAEVEVLARRRRSGDPALQGAFLGALSARTQ